MATYRYQALTSDGRSMEGVVQAETEFEAVGMIKQSYAVVEEIREISEGKPWNRDITISKVKEKPLAIACSQIAIALQQGLPLVRSLGLIAKQTEDKNLRKILVDVAGEVAEGSTLTRSFELKGIRRLPSTFIETVRAGEEAGDLAMAFRKLQVYYEKAAKVRNKASSAMVYPILLIIASLFVILVIMAVAVPMFSSAFASMGVELPLATRMLIDLSEGIRRNWLLILTVFLAAGIGCRLYVGTEQGKLRFSQRKLTLPLLGKTAVMKSTSQFANTMATMLGAGLPVNRALAATAKAMDNYYLSKEVAKVVLEVEDGKSVAEGLKKSGFFPDLLLEMTSVGEETGSLEKTLDILGMFYDGEVETSSAKALSLLEPLIISVLAVFVIFILLAVYMPMFSLYGSF
ncbi:MAG: type II secretion system F family protein [Eubacteriales bacterium]|nr:type II secretion system F family protein [Eubacteriales bacterium]